MVSHVACCSTRVHHEGQQEAYLQSVVYNSNPVLHGNVALSVVYFPEHAVGLRELIL